MENLKNVAISLELPRDLSVKLGKHILDLSLLGIKETKASLIIRYSEEGVERETKEKDAS